MKPLMPLVTVNDVQKIRGFCQGLLRRAGAVVGSTKEQPVSGDFHIPPWSLTAIVDGLTPLLSPAVQALDAELFPILEEKVLATCTEDALLGRDAVVKSGNGYQHFFIRDGALIAVIHASELELSEFLHYFSIVFRTLKVVVGGLPKGYELKRIQFRWSVDCLYTPVKESVANTQDEQVTVKAVL